jgi:hypothetical protein
MERKRPGTLPELHEPPEDLEVVNIIGIDNASWNAKRKKRARKNKKVDLLFVGKSRTQEIVL